MGARLDVHAERFQVLGNPIRLAILRIIVQGGKAGTPVGQILARIGIPASTLSHHLSRLAKSGLAIVQRDGVNLLYRAHFQNLHKLTDYLWEDCCKGGDLAEPADCTQACTGSSKPRGRTRK